MKPIASFPLLAAALLACAACQADKVSTPRARKPAAAELSTAAPPLAPGDLALLGASIDDAADRLAPALADPGASAQLGAQLHLLSSTLLAGDAAGARAALAAARTALGRAGETPDGAAIGLALDRAESVLADSGSGRPDASRPATQSGGTPH